MRTGRLLLALVATVLFAAPARAEGPPSVLGSEGEVYRLLQGTAGALLGTKGEAASNSVLALEIARPGEAVERLGVPGTEDDAVEKHPALSLDEATNTVFLVWEAQRSIHSTLHLAAHGPAGWSEVFELSGDPWSFKSHPRVAAVADTYRRIGEDGEPVTASRVVLHLVWWDVGASASRVLYTALVVEGGEFIPDWRVLALDSFLPEAEEPGDGPLPAGLLESPRLEVAGDGGVVIAFGDGTSGRVATLHARPVAGELVSFADAARAQIIEIGRQSGIADRRALAGEARAQIIEIGRRILAPELADLLGARFVDAVGASDPGDELARVADDARAQIIEIGVTLGEGPRRQHGAARAQIIEIGRHSATGALPHLARFRVASVRPAPSLPEGRAIRLIPVHGGGDLILAWDTEGAVRYRQSLADGWSEVRVLTLGEELTREQAYALLERR